MAAAVAAVRAETVTVAAVAETAVVPEAVTAVAADIGCAYVEHFR